MAPQVPPELIFELGRLQVFHYPTPEAKANKASPTEVYWQDTLSRYTYGPFPSTYEAMSHYTWVVANQKPGATSADVIHVDFVRKKRLVFEVP